MFQLQNYCPKNESLLFPWLDDGFTPCFLETLNVILPLTLLLTFGVTQFIVYVYITHTRVLPSSDEVGNDPHPPSSKELFWAQCVCLWMVPLIAVVRFILQTCLLYEHIVVGYQLFVLLGTCTMWLLSFYLVYVERRWQIPGLLYPRRHSLPLLLFWTSVLVLDCLAFTCLKSDLWFWKLQSPSDQAELGLWIVDFVCKLGVFLLGLRAPGLPGRLQWHQRLHEDTEDETRDLASLTNSIQEITQGAAGTSSASNKSTWRGAYRKMRLLAPYLWPKKSFSLQLRVATCLFLLVIGRVVNLYTPITYKMIVDGLTVNTTHVNTTQFGFLRLGHLLSVPAPVSVSMVTSAVTGLVFRWDMILIYVALRGLQGISSGSGILGLLRTQLWIPVQQYTMREMALRLFDHLHGLPLQWHLSRKTGEVLRVMDRGTDSIDNILNYMLFNVAPTIVDILIGVVYFASAFNLWFGLIVLVTMLLYMASTIIVVEWRTKYRRIMNAKDNAKNATAVDSLLNFETVKYYDAEKFEAGRYRSAIEDYQAAEWMSQSTLNLLNLVQNSLINLGFLAGALLSAHFVVDGEGGFTVGDFVLFCTYIVQLYAPLNMFGTFYRMIQTSFVDMENMFAFLAQESSVKDLPDASQMRIEGGEIEFNNVSFHYLPEKPVLQNVSFRIPPGKTLALVGQSGGGKSTVVRLLNRFYDVTEGEIRIDGQNIAHVTQTSLRRAIGVVPQDTVLFNADIRYNIRYGRITASDNEVEEAARAADIHQRICGFPQGYETVVGERGLKLSGGEKQRVVIARTLLKAPRIVLLDEATSALDTATERNIQMSLSRVCEQRTTLVVAHRLSTIVNADEIVVLHEGRVVERGTHRQLLETCPDGYYATMWNQQKRESETEEKNSEEDKLYR